MYIFVTGTDTDAGKSYVARGLCRELVKNKESVGYLKPFQSGVIKGVPSDMETVNFENAVNARTSYVTKTPCTPLISAEIDGVDYDIKKVVFDYENLKKECENVIVEGSGGIYVPVKKSVLMADIIKKLNIPVLIVARPDLGTINHTLMTIECLLNNDIRVSGVVISNFPEKTEDPAILRAKEMIEMFSGDVKVLATIKHNQKDFSDLLYRIAESFTARKI